LIIKQNYKKFDGPCWILVSDVIDQVFQTTIPIELLRFTGNKHGSVESGTEIEQQLDVDHAILKCGVHLFVLQLVRDLCLEYEDEAQMILSGNSLPISSPTSGIKGNISTSSIASSVLLASNNEEESKEKCFVSQFPSDFLIRMPPQCRNRLLSCLHASFVFSNAFNSNYELRLLLLRSNVVQQMPNLIKQETQSIGTYLSLLFHLYRHEGDIQHDELQEDGQDILANSALVYKRNNQDILKCLVEESTNVIHRYSDFLVDAAKNNRDIVAWSSIIRLIWKEINSIRWQEESSDKSYKDFKKTIPAFFKLAVKLISSDRPDIRSVLQDFLNRIANYLENAMQ
jgi:brefeldin A-inhibited guanine nucleotide-exchange protein